MLKRQGIRFLVARIVILDFCCLWMSCELAENSLMRFLSAWRSFALYSPSVSVKVSFKKATVGGVVLAKVGNPSREEPLETSKEVCQAEEKDRPFLTELLLKSFRSFDGFRFAHHSSLEQNEVYACAKAVFEKEEALLSRGQDLAKRLYAKSSHPNIKSGDLCVAHIQDIIVDGQATQGLCVLKSETVESFLSIRSEGGDLKLTTEQGINPDKIDKGCLVLNAFEEAGYYVLTFDRAGAVSRFWVRDFLAVEPITDDAFLTSSYTDLAMDFLQKEKERAEDGVISVANAASAARDAVGYFEGREHFSLQEFEEEVLRKDPEMVAKFQEQKARYEEESGQKLGDRFAISKKDVDKARKRVGGVMKLDTGVEIRLLPTFEESSLEKGFDESRQMDFVKVYFHTDLEKGLAG